MIDYLPIWRDTEAIRACSYDGFVSQFGKLQLKLKQYLGVLFKDVGLVSVAKCPGGTVGVCSFVSVPIDGLRFECKIIVDTVSTKIKVSQGDIALGRFLRNDLVEPLIIEVSESKSWSDVSLLVLEAITKMHLGGVLKNQTKA